MNRKAFLAAAKYITTESFCINLAPTIYIRTNKTFIADNDYLVVRDIEHKDNVNIIPYSSILYIHE